MHYALSRVTDEGPYAVYGKGGDAAEAEHDALHNIGDDRGDATVLRENLIVATREEAEQQGFVKPGAPVIWYDNFRRYNVEDHGPFHPSAVQRRLQNML